VPSVSSMPFHFFFVIPLATLFRHHAQNCENSFSKFPEDPPSQFVQIQPFDTFDAALTVGRVVSFENGLRL
jgi:hypothetical protein